MKLHTVQWILVCLCVSFLSACERKENFHDLHDYIVNLENTHQPSKKPPAEFAVKMHPVSYQNVVGRTPFDETHHGGETNGNINPLSGYTLNTLRFIGTVSQNNKVWAYILTPDNKIYRVTMGDRIGDHLGKVNKITANEVEIVEPSSGADNQGAQRIITLQLKEEG